MQSDLWHFLWQTAFNPKPVDFLEGSVMLPVSCYLNGDGLVVFQAMEVATEIKRKLEKKEKKRRKKEKRKQEALATGEDEEPELKKAKSNGQVCEPQYYPGGEQGSRRHF